MLRLISPSGNYYEAFARAVDDYRLNDLSGLAQYKYEKALQNFGDYIKMLSNRAEGIGLPNGYVPQTHYWLLGDEMEIVGFVRLRHFLVPFLEDVGGHIGYNVPPSQRGKGYATELLRLTLEKAWERAINKVLVTTNDDNMASIRVIQKNGGVQDIRTSIDPESGKTVLRFWINNPEM